MNETPTLPEPAQAILDFWFGSREDPEHGRARPQWFRTDPDFDARVRERFGPCVEQLLGGGGRHWDSTPAGTLARILALDQFTRNIYRDRALAFAGDALALQAALRLIEAQQDRTLAPLQRWFVYLPLEHAEDLALQQRSVALFEALASEDPGLDGAADYARRHRDVIARFGRFPHRNAVLGRPSTDAELDYLAQPGAGF